MNNKVIDCIIIGAGAAGLFCAGNIGKHQRSVMVLEHNQQAGKKIRISGGGRCNFTNRSVKAHHFISENPHFPISALSRYTPDDFINLVNSHSISYHEKTLGQLFCDHSSQQIIDMLINECDPQFVKINYGVDVISVQHNDIFCVETSLGIFHSRSLVIATGGLSIPTLGASSFGYDIAKSFGHSIISTKPALVPLTIDSTVFPCSSLAGVSFVAEVSAGTGPEFKESILFTHKGLSGPAILQASSYLDETLYCTINTLPAFDITILNNYSNKSEWRTALGTVLPKRFADVWTTLHHQKENISHYSDKTLQSYIDELQSWTIICKGTEGYAKAEVTAGGVNTKELSSKTMMSTIIPHLYFIGEVVDVTGHLGGYNFQWAWSSAYAASESIQQYHG